MTGIINRTLKTSKVHRHTRMNIQGVSGGIVNILGGVSMDYSK
jgi:hypothetical protein